MKKLMFWLGVLIMLGSSILVPSLALAATDPVATAAGNNTGAWNNAFSITIGPYTFLDESLPNRSGRPSPSDTFVIQNPPTRACAPGGGSHVGDDTDYITNQGGGWILHYWTFSQIAGDPAGSCSGEQTKSISVAGQSGTQGAYFVFSDPSTITTGNGRRIYTNTGPNTYTEESSDLVGISGNCHDVITLNPADIVNGQLKNVAGNATYVMRTSNVENTDSLPASINSISSTKDASGCYYAPGVKVTVTDVQNGPTSLNPATPSPTGAAPAADPCATAGGAYAWVLCPLVSKVDTFLTGTIYSTFIQPVLQINPLNSGQDASLRSVSATFVDLADVVFVIVFLIMIFGNTLSIDSYTVKKVLPRLIVAAIAIQFSYFLCGIAVDIGNVLGSGIEDLVVTALNPGNPTAQPLAQEIISTASTAFLGTTGVMALIATGAAAYIFLGPMVLLLILGLALSVIIFFFTLILRQLLISVLIVLAPVAIVAWILPNTQSLFKKWWQNFIKIIMVYPIISLLLASGLLFQRISGANGFVAELASGIAPIVIFFMMPMAFKWGGSLMNLAGKVAVGSGLGAGARAATNAGKQPFKKLAANTKANLAASRNAKIADQATGTGFGARRAQISGGFGFGLTAASRAQRDQRLNATRDKLDKEASSAAARQLRDIPATYDDASGNPDYATGLVGIASAKVGDTVGGIAVTQASQRVAIDKLAQARNTKALAHVRQQMAARNGGSHETFESALKASSSFGDIYARAPQLTGSGFGGLNAKRLGELDAVGAQGLLDHLGDQRKVLASATATPADKVEAQKSISEFEGALGSLSAPLKAAANADAVRLIYDGQTTAGASAYDPAVQSNVHAKIDRTQGRYT
jgi:hypothetical protein